MVRAIVRYTPEQLQHLRESPLVQKPDGLPSIEQWMEPQPDQTNKRPRSQVLRDGEPPANGEARADRPILTNMGMGNFGRRPSTQPEDTVLGPPKLSFTSASRSAKPPDAEKRTLSTLESEGSLADRIGSRERWSKDRFDAERARDKPGYLNGRRGGREEGEGWTNVKSRKSLGQDEIERPHRNIDRDRDRFQKDGDLDSGELASRRPGLGRGRFDQPWGREDTGAKEGDGPKTGARGQGWRDRERDKERERDPLRDRDRDWNRGRGGIEEDPEWMDTPVTNEKKPARTQEDFQRWKEAQALKTTKPQDKEALQEPALSAPEPASVPASLPGTVQQKATTPFAMDVGTEKLFGMWGEAKRTDYTAVENATLPKATKAKAKPSRFAGLFSPPEESVPRAQAAVEASTSPEPASNVNADNQDKEGFNRILQMLTHAHVSQQPNPASTPSNGTRVGARSDFQNLQGDEGAAMLLHNRQQAPPRTRDDGQFAENMVSPRPSIPDGRSPAAMFGLHSPEHEAGPDQYRLARPESGRPTEDFPFQPPSRNGAGQGATNLQALFQGGARTTQEPNEAINRDFLLTLMKQRDEVPPQIAAQTLPRRTPDNSNFLQFMENNTMKAQGPPKNRGPPPGIYDEHRIYQDNEMLRLREASIRENNMRDAGIREANIREANMREANIREANIRDANMRDASMREGMPQNEAFRKAMQRPPGIYDDPSIASLSRRNTTENMPRQPTNMGIPQQPVQDVPLWMKGPGLPQQPQERNVAPPPGFPSTAMRQPPGFGGPPVGAQPQMPFGAGNSPLGHPGMLPPRGMGGLGMFPGQAQQMPPPGPLGGYFGAPPGFGPMGMPRGDDPRLMMGPPRRPDYDQFNRDPNVPPRNGRPGDMYQM